MTIFDLFEMRFSKTFKKSKQRWQRTATVPSIFVGQVRSPYELVISGSFCLYSNGIALQHRIFSTAPLNKLQTTFYRRGPIHQAPPQPTMLCRAHAGPARAVRTVPIPIWPRALQWPCTGSPYKFHMVQTIYAKNNFLKIIKNVSLLACFNF